MRWMGALRSVLLSTCRDAAPLISQAMDRGLAAQDRAAVRLHLLICPSCRRYRGQLVMLRRLLALIHDQVPAWRLEPLAPEARTRILLDLTLKADPPDEPR